MSDRSITECKLIVGGIKKVCHEKHKRVDVEIDNVRDMVRSINAKLLALGILIVIEVIIVTYKIIISAN